MNWAVKTRPAPVNTIARRMKSEGLTNGEKLPTNSMPIVCCSGRGRKIASLETDQTDFVGVDFWKTLVKTKVRITPLAHRVTKQYH